MELPLSISKIKRKNIKEAVKEWNREERKTSISRVNFYGSMMKFGWNKTSVGGYKSCIVKDSIAIKWATDAHCFESINEVNRELEQWELTDYKFKRYLPIIYIIHKGLIIQDRVLVKCHEDIHCKSAKEIAKKFGLVDYGHNHGHTIKGTVKFFDWVYNRSWQKVNDKNIPFLAK